VEVCALTGAGGAPAAPYLDAGTISTAGMNKAVSFTFDNSKTGYAPFSNGSTTLWSGGETVSVTSPGGTGVEAFTAQVKAPKKLTVLTPAAKPNNFPFANEPYLVDRDRPYQVSWNDTANADVEVVISSTSADKTKTAQVSCRFAPEASPSYVPRELLGDLIQGGTSKLSIAALNKTSVALAAADVSVRLGWGTRFGPVTLTGVGNVAPIDTATCQAAGTKAANQCPGTPISASTCGAASQYCRACVTAADGDCAALARCDADCGVVTPGSAGTPVLGGATLSCSAGCKAENCVQKLAAPTAATTSLAIVGDVLLFNQDADSALVARVSAAGGLATTFRQDGALDGAFRVQDGFLYSFSSQISRTDLSTAKRTYLVGTSATPGSTPAIYRLEGDSIVYSTTGGLLRVADLTGANQRSIATFAPFNGGQAVATTATHAYVAVRQANGTLTLSRALLSATDLTDSLETVASGVALTGSAPLAGLEIAGNSAFFIQKNTATLFRVDLTTKAVTTLALPAAKYTGLTKFGNSLYLSSEVGVVRVDGTTAAVSGTFNVGPVGAMTVDSERVYFAVAGAAPRELRSFCQ
jgi:hypothetical protein